MEPLHLYIAIPSMDRVHADFMMNLIHLNQTLFNNPIVESMGLTIINRRGSLLVDSREGLVDQALEVGATHILFLDSDMSFPQDLFHRLYQHDLPAVACNYVQRTIPARSNSRDLNGVGLFTFEDSQGLEEAQAAGYGACLFKAEIFKKLSKPWFDTVWLQTQKDKVYWPDKLQLLGEDLFFFKKLKHELNISLYIDHDLSKELGHIDEFEYTNNLAGIV